MAWPPACSRPPRRKPQPAKTLYDAVGVTVGCESWHCWWSTPVSAPPAGGSNPNPQAACLAASPRCCHRATLHHHCAAPRFRALRNLRKYAMDIHETAAWIDGLFEGEMSLHEAKREEGYPTILATFETEEQISLCSTIGFNEVDTGLESGGLDVRCEFFTITEASQSDAMHVVDATVQTLVQANGTLHAQPDTIIPGIGLAVLPEHLTVCHGLFVAPEVWGPSVPQFIEDDRWTLMLELLLITEDEFNYAVTYGARDLLDELEKTGVNLLDWQR